MLRDLLALFPDDRPNRVWFAFTAALVALAAHHAWWSAAL